jgi:ADP-ribose pyrophosphatase
MCENRYPRPRATPDAQSDHPVVLAEGRFLRLVRRGNWEYADRTNAHGAVVILAVTDDGNLVLTEQFRIPLDRPTIEMPAGLAGDTPGDEAGNLKQAARRELLEETGYAAREMTCLISGPTSGGLSTEIITLFRATGLTKVAGGGGIDQEAIQVHEIPLASAHAWLASRMAAGVLVDPKVFAGLYFAGQR